MRHADHAFFFWGSSVFRLCISALAPSLGNSHYNASGSDHVAHTNHTNKPATPTDQSASSTQSVHQWMKTSLPTNAIGTTTNVLLVIPYVMTHMYGYIAKHPGWRSYNVSQVNHDVAVLFMGHCQGGWLLARQGTALFALQDKADTYMNTAAVFPPM